MTTPTLARMLYFTLLFTATLPVQAGWWEKGKALLESLDTGDNATTTLGTNEIAAGLREALKVGTGNVVSQLGQTNGYYKDPRAHIPLPDSLASVRDVLEKVGMGDTLNDLELRMNRAAEAAAPKARDMFIDAITNMTLEDAKSIYNGPDDAATRFFQKQMSDPLTAEFTPVVNNSLAQVGAIQSYDQVMSQYQKIPFVPDVKANLSQYVVDHAISTIFDYLATEEAAIRANPAKRTTELLRKVFGR